MSSLQTLNTQVLQVLSANSALWDICCGPNGNGLTIIVLLAELIDRFPASSWTEDLLELILLTSQRQGRIKMLPPTEENNEITYYLFTAMNLVNPVNKVYQSTSGSICPVPSSCWCNNTFVA